MKTIAVTIFVAFVTLCCVCPVTNADVMYNQDATEWSSSTVSDIPNGIIPIGGSGQVNGFFAVDSNLNGAQIGLRASQRSVGPFASDASGLYIVEPGPDPNNPARAWWNYDVHIDLRGSGTTLDDYAATLTITNNLNGLSAATDLALLNVFFGTSGIELFQTSQNPVFSVFGFETLNPPGGFDPDVAANYTFLLDLIDDEIPANSLSVSIDVVNLVPEPTSLAIWSLLGLGAVGYQWRRRKRPRTIHYSGTGRMISAFSANDASPVLPLIRYWTFNRLAVPGKGSPPKLPL